MSEIEIVTKLRSLLATPDEVLLSEPGALYLMVQIRKLIDFDRTRTENLLAVKFYCDWLLHSKKEHALKDIEEALHLAYASIQLSITKPDVMPMPANFIDLIGLNDLNSNLREIFNHYSFNDKLLMSAKLSDKFQKALLKILHEQPLITTTNFQIKSIEIIEADDRGFKVKVLMREPLILPDGGTETEYVYRLDTTAI